MTHRELAERLREVAVVLANYAVIQEHNEKLVDENHALRIRLQAAQDKLRILTLWIGDAVDTVHDNDPKRE